LSNYHANTNIKISQISKNYVFGVDSNLNSFLNISVERNQHPEKKFSSSLIQYV